MNWVWCCMNKRNRMMTLREDVEIMKQKLFWWWNRRTTFSFDIVVATNDMITWMDIKMLSCLSSFDQVPSSQQMVWQKRENKETRTIIPNDSLRAQERLFTMKSLTLITWCKKTNLSILLHFHCTFLCIFVLVSLLSYHVGKFLPSRILWQTSK
jgi:hypothetical protein